MIAEFSIKSVGKYNRTFSIKESEVPNTLLISISDETDALATILLSKKDWEELANLVLGNSTYGHKFTYTDGNQE